MLRIIKNNKAQAVMGEYVIVFFVAIGVITAMSTYFQRVVQGRIYDARDSMVRLTRNQSAGFFNGNIFFHYEPYYQNTDSETYRSLRSRTSLAEGGTSGVYRMEYDDLSRIMTTSVTKPPREADREYE
ncbi:MAG: hypothetical protein KKF78_06555 [Candidatus Omnitrophica bacterium]|nr:hypothetical protein [Candidatus Omnitrophota bacterium]MBU1996798.1 hypothetical protein [Candidatus Omnitrophota bacterium]